MGNQCMKSHSSIIRGCRGKRPSDLEKTKEIDRNLREGAIIAIGKTSDAGEMQEMQKMET